MDTGLTRTAIISNEHYPPMISKSSITMSRSKHLGITLESILLLH